MCILAVASSNTEGSFVKLAIYIGLAIGVLACLSSSGQDTNATQVGGHRFYQPAREWLHIYSHGV